MDLDSINMQLESHDKEENVHDIQQLDMELDSASNLEPYASRTRTIECSLNICINLFDVKINEKSINKIYDYLIKFPYISNVLLIAAHFTRIGFGNRVNLYLDYYQSRECGGEFIKLYVRQHQYDKDIIKKIRRIRELYINKFDEFGNEDNGWFLLTTDFNKVRDDDEI
jgi:hypothetical protein